MCLLAIAYRVHPRYPLVLVGNRDEFHARPALPLAPWADDGSNGSAPAPARLADHAIVGGRDAQAGGAWLALTPGGRLGAVTNVRLVESATGNAQPASRGALIPAFLLGEGRAPEAARGLLAEAPRFGAFNLLLYDGAALAYLGNRPTPHAQPVTPGLHGLSNAALDTPWPKTERLVTALGAWIATDAAQLAARERRREGDARASVHEPALDLLFAALADATPAPDATLPDTGVGLAMERRLSPAFIRGADYGTRASSVVLIGAALAGKRPAIRFEERRWGPNGMALGRSRWVQREDD